MPLLQKLRPRLPLQEINMDIGGVVHAFFNNAGPGGVFALIIVGGACTLYYFLVRWVVRTGKRDEPASPEEQPVSVDA